MCQDMTEWRGCSHFSPPDLRCDLSHHVRVQAVRHIGQDLGAFHPHGCLPAGELSVVGCGEVGLDSSNLLRDISLHFGGVFRIGGLQNLR